MRKKLLPLIILLMFSLTTTSVFAAGEIKMKFDDFLRTVQEQAGIESFKQPTPMFKVKTPTAENGEELVYPKINEKYDNIEDPDAMKKIPAREATIPVGKEIEVLDASLKGAGNKINAWEWQVYYWDKDEKYVDYQKFDTKDIKIKAEQEGYVIIFLNVADDFVPTFKDTNTPMNFANWSNLGNWKTKGRTVTEVVEVTDWYFTVGKFKVVGSENDMGMKEPVKLIDKSGVNVSKYTKDEPYKLQFSLEHVLGDIDIGLDSIKNPKATIDIEVKDDSQNKLLIQTLQTDEMLKKGSTIEMPLSDSFIPKTNSFTACATINPIHKELGFNSNPENDKICKTFTLESIDIGMKNQVKLINQRGEQITQYKKNEPLRIVFPVEHVKGEEAVGLNDINNPKVIINTNITDKDDKVISQERIQTPKILNPNEFIDMPQTQSFTTNSDKITVCATIDPIHAEKGYNDNPKNDKICATFHSDGVDIGMAAPVILLRDGKSTLYLDPRYEHQVQFNVAHYLGEESVGLDALNNPKVIINVTVTDINGRTLVKQDIQASEVLKKGAKIAMPPSNSFSGKSGQITACAVIDQIHAEKGYNTNKSNDGMCATFYMAKNYSIKDVKVTPQSEYLAPNESSVKKPISVTFTVGNESRAETGTLPSNPLVTIKYRGSEVWKGQVSVAPGTTSIKTVGIGVLDIYPGDNKIVVEVNPDRKEVEFLPGVSNPYLDNVGTQNITTKRYQKCLDCIQVRERNTWTERFSFKEQRGNVVTKHFNYCLREEERTGRECVEWDDNGKCTDHETYTYYACVEKDYNVPYEVCNVTYSKKWTEDKDYYETFKIKNIFFRSKYTNDNQGGWVDLLGNKVGKIKAGYGFELRIVTEYVTNRNIMPTPNPYQGNPYKGDKYGQHSSGYCDYITRSPGVTPVDSPNILYMLMPYKGRNSSEVCYLLTPTGGNGYWYNSKKDFELPLRNSFGIKDERKIYTNEDAGVGTYTIKLRTPQWYGYNPEAPVNLTNKKLMQDCESFRIEILAQDDLKTHIMQ